MKITIYGAASCDACLFIKKKLKDLGLDFDYIDDYNKTLELVRKHKLKKFPVIKLNDEIMSMDDFLKKKIDSIKK